MDVTSTVPARLDALPWSRWHTRLVVALGITWMLDGLEVTLVGSLGPALTRADTLGLSVEQVGLAGTAYLAGAILGALLFGHLADVHGRKKLFVVTLALYVLACVGSAFARGPWDFFAFRLLTGAAIGGEYAAINSAIDELVPARVRGAVDLAINGTYWLGALAGALLTTRLLGASSGGPAGGGHAGLLPPWLGFRIAFGLGALLSVSIVLVRRHVPESPRWLLTHGRSGEAEAICREAERITYGDAPPDPAGARAVVLPAADGSGLAAAARLLVGRHRRRAVLGLGLMAAQAFFYNSIFFSHALVVSRFFGVPEDEAGETLVPFAIANFLGPLLLGPLFDRVGRRRMLVATYGGAGLLLGATALAFGRGALDVRGHTLAFAATFFVGSAAASAAYLTVSELFPSAHRASAIAFFYAAGTALGGLLSPWMFGRLVATGDAGHVVLGYGVGAAAMLAAAALAGWLAVDAERKGLEELG